MSTKTVTHHIQPDKRGGQNHMDLTYYANERMVGAKYRIHFWNDSVEEVIGRLERMIAALREFQKSEGVK